MPLPPAGNRPSMPCGDDVVPTKPMSSAPMMPPTRCTPTTSSESSSPNLYFNPTAHAHTMPATAPTTIAPTTFTEPQDGVIAPSPATTPDAAPSGVALPCKIRSMANQPSIAHIVATVVFRKVTPVSPVNMASND